MSTKCKCGANKRRSDILCGVCMKALPAKLRAAFYGARDSEARRAAVQAISDHINGTPSMF